MKVMGKKDDRVLLFDFKEEPVKPEHGKGSGRGSNNPKGCPRPGGAEASAKAAETKSGRLTPIEKKFCMEYVKTGNARNSVMNAGYNFSNLNTAGNYATDLLKMPKIQRYIDFLQSGDRKEAIATATEVMEFLTRIMNGEEKDQFGLDLSAGDRLKAAVELAKRTVDLENKVKMAQDCKDNTITVKLDWTSKGQ